MNKLAETSISGAIGMVIGSIPCLFITGNVIKTVELSLITWFAFTMGAFAQSLRMEE